MAHRFASLTTSDILAKRAKITPQNTVNANLKCARTLRNYLAEKKQDEDFEKYSPERLNETLTFFYLDARKEDGDFYKSSSLENFRYSLNRYLKAPPFLAKFDIIRDTEFIEANESFKTALGELKQAGKGDVVHYPEINSADLRTLYGSIYLSPNTPFGLANKVQFDIRLYFCRRGGENMAEMTKNTFSVKTNHETGHRFVEKSVDELTKNRRAKEKEAYGGVMPEIPESDMCPVKSFIKYINKLNPDLERLWQRPKDSFLPDEPCWFYRRPLGKDTLSHFMSNLSKSVGLTTHYTNHSVRVTGATILSRSNFSPAQIMSVTGHRAASSLSVYQRVNGEEKVSMGHAISDAILPSKIISSGNSSASMSSSHVAPAPLVRSTAVVPSTAESSGFDDDMSTEAWENFFLNDPFAPNSAASGTENLSVQRPSINSAAVSVNLVQQSVPPPIFQNCQIGKVEIVFRK